MALYSRRVGVAGITAGALLCVLCGLPFVAAGIGGISFFAFLVDFPVALKIIIVISGVIIVALPVVVMTKRNSKSSTELDQ